MMRQQYRIATASNWPSNFGFAGLAMVNKSGSGRKVTIRSLEVQVQSVNNGGAAAGSLFATLYRCASPLLDGEDMRSRTFLFDSTASFPSTVVVRRLSTATSYSTVIRRLDMARRTGAVGTQNSIATAMPSSGIGRRGMGAYRSSVGPTASVMEPIKVNQNEAVALVPESSSAPWTNPVRVHILFSIDGKTLAANFTTACSPGLSVFSVENTGTSSVLILGFGITEVGTSDTPTIRVVPIGQLYSLDVADAPQKNVGVIKMDSSYPDLTAVDCYSDIGIIPQGVPEVYFAEGSAGSPKGLNYLHTRDFQGPMWRNFLPETCHMKGVGSGLPDMLGYSYGMRGSDLLARSAGITLNPGEGMALVSSAETAVGVQAAYSGWPTLLLAAQIDVEPQYSPSLTLTGLQAGSDIVILAPGTSTEYLNVDANPSSSYTWPYDPDLISNADVCVYKSGYVPLAFRGLSLGLAGATIPVAQSPDRNYSNP